MVYSLLWVMQDLYHQPYLTWRLFPARELLGSPVQVPLGFHALGLPVFQASQSPPSERYNYQKIGVLEQKSPSKRDKPQLRNLLPNKLRHPKPYRSLDYSCSWKQAATAEVSTLPGPYPFCSIGFGVFLKLRSRIGYCCPLFSYYPRCMFGSRTL